MKCAVPPCRENRPKGNAFCWRCRKLVGPDENWALRMAQSSPMIHGWAGYVTGREVMTQLNPDGTSSEVRGVSRIETLLHYVEFWHTAALIGERIAREEYGYGGL